MTSKHKRYDNQADEYPLYLYEGHELTNAQHYIEELNNRIGLLYDLPKDAAKLNNENTKDVISAFLLFNIVNELFGGAEPQIKAKNKQIAMLNELIQELAEAHEIPQSFYTVQKYTNDLYLKATINYERYQDRIKTFKLYTDTMLHYCKGWQDTLTDNAELFNLLIASNNSVMNNYYKHLNGIIEILEKERTDIYALYKYLNCHNIFMDMLADLLQIQELKTFKINLFECKELLDGLNINILLSYNAILGIEKGKQVANPPTDQQQATADKLFKLAIKDGSRLLRPSNTKINAVYDKLAMIDYIHEDGIEREINEDGDEWIIHHTTPQEIPNIFDMLLS